MKKLITPTFNQLIQSYLKIAEMERMKSEQPCATTVWNVVNGVRQIIRAVAIEGEEPITSLTRRKIDGFLGESVMQGKKAVTAWSYVLCLRGIAARWTRPYYEDLGYKVVPFDIPVCRRKLGRYVRPDRETLLKVKAWYESLEIKADRREWLAVTMMLEFAMRNGDVGRLRWCDFRIREDSPVLCYTPHKTEQSSGRVVAWPVHPLIWEKISVIRETSSAHEGTHFQGLVVPAAKEVFDRLNKDIRSRHLFQSAKGCYELRKICIDHIYQKFGAEKASAISGDDIRTVTRYYADPSVVTSVGVRIVDLI